MRSKTLDRTAVGIGLDNGAGDTPRIDGPAGSGFEGPWGFAQERRPSVGERFRHGDERLEERSAGLRVVRKPYPSDGRTRDAYPVASEIACDMTAPRQR